MSREAVVDSKKSIEEAIVESIEKKEAHLKVCACLTLRWVCKMDKQSAD